MTVCTTPVLFPNCTTIVVQHRAACVSILAPNVLMSVQSCNKRQPTMIIRIMDNSVQSIFYK